MAFSLEIMRSWTNGSVLSGAEDMIPQQALRVGQNVRLDRVRGLIVSRPGMTQLTSAPIDGGRPRVVLHTKLYGASADWGYAQVVGTDGALYRVSTTWQTPAQLVAGLPASCLLSETNWVDGYTHPWKYFLGCGQASKDNGTQFMPWGMTGPTEPPSAAFASGVGASGGNVSLGTREDVFINSQPPSPYIIPSGGVGFFQTYHGQALTGTHNGPADSATLVDTTRDFFALGCAPGWFVQGWHGSDPSVDRFVGRVSAVTATTLESVSGNSGGELWQPGDMYQVLINMALGGVQVAPGHTATGGSGTTLVDSGVDFQALGVQPDMYLLNMTTGGGGRVTGLRTTTNPNDTLEVANGFRAEPGVLEPTHEGALAGDQYMVYNTLASQDDLLIMEMGINPVDRAVHVSVFLGVSPHMGLDAVPDVNSAGMDPRAQKLVNAPPLVGGPPWYHLDLKKRDFDIVTSSPEPFQMIGTYVVAITVNSSPGVTGLAIGTVLMQRGSGPGGQVAVRYTATYMVSGTGEESSPPKTVDEVVRYSNTITAERQVVQLDLSRIARAPVAGGIDRLAIYRQKEGEALAYLVTTVPSDQTTFVDTVADANVNIAHVLEPDNDPPPADGVVLFGPGAQQRLFMIRDRNKLRFSKAWEYHKDRASNWPFQFELQIGDGSQEALNGLMTDQSIFVWSEDQTWQIVGQGADAYVPLPVPLSHGLLARWCLCSGDGRIFFLAKDGIYQQQGLTQQKISGDLDPFFTEETVHGIAPLSRDPALLARYQMAWYPHPTEPEVVLIYGVAGDSVPSRRLVLKRNPQTGQYTDAFFDTSVQLMQSIYADPQALTLTFGTNHSHIWQAEVPTETTDAGTAISGRVRLPARDQNVPRVVKTYSDIVVEANTLGTVLTVQAAFNRSTETMTAGTVTSGADNQMAELPLAQTSPPAQLRRHHIALDLTWSGTTRMTITQLGWHAQLEAEDLTFLDTGPLVFDSQTTLRRIHFTYDATTTVTAQVTMDGVALAAFVLPATSGRTRYDQVISLPPALTRGKIFRLTLTSAAPSLVYAAIGEFEPEPLPVTAWDSRDIPFDTRQIVRQILFDIEAPVAVVTATWYIDGVVAETWTVGPGAGRQRLNRVLVSGTQVVQGTVYRLTLTSTNPFQIWGLEGVTETQPLATTFWDSRELTYDTPQILRQLLFDLDAPAAATATLYVDGTVRETFGVGPTSGRSRINYVSTTGAALLRGMNYRLTLASATALTLWGLEGVLEAQVLPTTAWDSRELTYDTPQILRQLLFDIDAPAACTATLYVDGTVQETFTVGPTAARARINYVTTSGEALLRGMNYRVTLTSGAALTLWGLQGVLEAQPLHTTFWDSREVTYDTSQILRQLLFDLDAPAVANATLYIDGVSRETFAVGPTAGRARINYVTTTGIQLVRGQVYRVTLDSDAFLTLWGLNGVMEAQPLATTFWDSREVTFETMQLIRQLFFDLDAPAVCTVTVYVDGAVPASGVFTVGPTNGRERIDHLFNPPLHGRVFRVTMASASSFTLWNLSMQAENEPLSTTFWDTRQVPFLLVHAIKWYALDLDAPSGATVVTEINGTVRDSRAIPATTGRQRINVWLPAGIKGRSVRTTLTGATPLQLWGFTAMMKPWGTSQGYTPQTLLEAIQQLQEKSLTANEQRQSSKPFVVNEQRQSSKPFVVNEQRQSSKPFVVNEQRVSNKPLVTIEQQRQERPFYQVGDGSGNRE